MPNLNCTYTAAAACEIMNVAVSFYENFYPMMTSIQKFQGTWVNTAELWKKLHLIEKFNILP